MCEDEHEYCATSLPFERRTCLFEFLLQLADVVLQAIAVCLQVRTLALRLAQLVLCRRQLCLELRSLVLLLRPETLKFSRRLLHEKESYRINGQNCTKIFHWPRYIY